MLIKKLLFVLIFISICATCFAKIYTLENNYVKLDITIEENNSTYISSIYDKKNKQEFIGKVDPNRYFWNVKVKKNRDFANPKAEFLHPKLAKSVDVKESKDQLVITYNGVRNETVLDEFTVVCSIIQKDNNNYFHIKVSSGKEWGIWEITYPYIADLDCQDGDNFFIPSRGDVFLREFSNPNGFPDPKSDDPNAYTKYYMYYYPLCLQYSSLTKGNSTLYMSPEDTSVCHKSFEFSTYRPNSINVYTTYYPENMGLAGYAYKQNNKYNISIVSGDYYDAAKKYRNWGIKSNYAPFKKGLIENRKDLPQWWKDLCLTSRTWNNDSNEIQSTIRATKEFNVPILVHLYKWGAFDFDTHYPDWTPINDKTKKFIKDLKEAGCYIMPYTNAHIVDSALSETAKKYGDDILKIGWNGKRFYENWAKDKGAENNIACTGSEYSNVYLEEVKRIFNEYAFDGFYMDQVGASMFGACFNEKHNHPLGGGTFAQTTYEKLLEDIKAETKKITGKDVVLTTEDGGDAIPFDGWLKVNEGKLKSENNPVRSLIYSGYVMNFGDNIVIHEVDDEVTAINKLGTQLSNGYMLGWQLFINSNYWKKENLVKYTKNAVKARESAKEYFNLGEMVRNINITSEIPKVHVHWYHFSTYDIGGVKAEANGIKSCVYYYHGKVMVCITNTTYDKQSVEWNAKPKDLYLKNKSAYKLTQTYPIKGKSVTLNKINNKVDINPLETVIFIIE